MLKSDSGKVIALKEINSMREQIMYFYDLIYLQE